MHMMRNILCLKYGSLYPPDYVNVLFNACLNACDKPFRFVCLTEDGNGIDPRVEVRPIPDVGLKPEQWRIGGVWPKLGIFASPLHDLRGRCLFIDLDMVICGGLDAFFDEPGDLVGINCSDDWGTGRQTVPPRLGTGVIAFDAGGLAHIVSTFQKDRDKVIARLRLEQMFVSEQVGSISYWPDDWVISFKRRLRQPLGADLFRAPERPPATARIVAFHGRPRPIDLVRGRPFFWDRFPHMGNGKVSWLRKYWFDNGGGPVQ